MSLYFLPQQKVPIRAFSAVAKRPVLTRRPLRFESRRESRLGVEPNSNSRWASSKGTCPNRRKTMSSLYSIGQMNQLGDALEGAGFTTEDVTKLKQFSNLAGLKNVFDGTAKIMPAEDAIRVIVFSETMIAVDLGAAPKLPFDDAKVEQHLGEGWATVEKRPDGLYVNGRKVILRLSKRQQGDKWLKGYELREELTGMPVLNANILDALYDNPHLIPEDWKRDKHGDIRYIFFWGTIFRRYASGRLYVRDLYFGDGVWRRDYFWLDFDWNVYYFAAVLAS